jgi:hypothetical protein
MRCGQCENGWVFYEEDGRMIKDVCYHCGNTGEVSEEIDFMDQLRHLAVSFAEKEEREYRQACNDDPKGDGYELYAAENMLTSEEYFRARVWDRSYANGEKLIQMTRSEQELLLAWSRMPIERVEKLTILPPSLDQAPDTLRDFGSTPPESFYADDDIPF